MSTADEINFKARAAWPIVDSLREKFDEALNEEMRKLMASWPSGRYFSSGAQLKGKIKPLARRRGPRGRRLALKARRAGWLPRVFGIDWGGEDRSVLRRGNEIVSVTEIDKTLFDPKA